MAAASNVVKIRVTEAELAFFKRLAAKRGMNLSQMFRKKIAEMRARKLAGHSTQKPVELYERAYKNHCRMGDHVYEPFRFR